MNVFPTSAHSIGYVLLFDEAELSKMYLLLTGELSFEKIYVNYTDYMNYMNTPQITEKTVGAFEIRQNFGKFLQGILAKGEKYIVERHGEPVAVVVPLTVYEQWKQNRSIFFDTMRRSQKQAGLTEKQADTLAREAVQVIRARDQDESRT